MGKERERGKRREGGEGEGEKRRVGGGKKTGGEEALGKKEVDDDKGSRGTRTGPNGEEVENGEGDIWAC